MKELTGINAKNGSTPLILLSKMEMINKQIYYSRQKVLLKYVKESKFQFKYWE